METAKSFLLMQLILLFFYSQSSQAQIRTVIHDTLPNGKVVARWLDEIPIGDINNDKIPDTAYVNLPNIPDNYSDWDCDNDKFCRVIIYFSCETPEPGWPIFFSSAVAADLENIGDIDGDGWSELIAVPHWIVGCWGKYYFYAMKNGRWREIGFIEHNICEEVPYRNCIKSIKENRITAIEQVWEDGDVVEKPKVIEVK